MIFKLSIKIILKKCGTEIHLETDKQLSPKYAHLWSLYFWEIAKVISWGGSNGKGNQTGKGISWDVNLKVCTKFKNGPKTFTIRDKILTPRSRDMK